MLTGVKLDLQEAERAVREDDVAAELQALVVEGGERDAPGVVELDRGISRKREEDCCEDQPGDPDAGTAGDGKRASTHSAGCPASSPVTTATSLGDDVSLTVTACSRR